MREKGVVKSISGQYMAVKIDRKSACGGNCAQCGACERRTHIVQVENKINARVGDTVSLELPSERIIKAAFLAYILPLVAMISGYYLVNLFTKNNAICALGGFIFMIIGFFLVNRYDKKYRKSYSPTAICVESCEK